MSDLRKQVEQFVKQELMKAGLEVFASESESLPSRSYGQVNRGVDFIVKTPSGKYHELFLQPINLDFTRSVKIPKGDLGEPKDNKRKSTELATLAKNFELSVSNFNEVSKAYTLQLAISKEHISAQDIKDLKPKIKAVVEAIKKFEKDNVGYRSIADIFWEKKAKKIRKACPESTPSKSI
ncbi:MAG: hypothetical protein AAF620_08595 [Bacteroidota bacterium]